MVKNEPTCAGSWIFTFSPFGLGAEFFTMRSIFHHNSAELFFMVTQNVKNAPCGAW